MTSSYLENTSSSGNASTKNDPPITSSDYCLVWQKHASFPNVKRSSYTVKLTRAQQQQLEKILREGNYRPLSVPHAAYAAEAENVKIVLYHSGTCLVQGAGAHDWMIFVLEPQVLSEARLGYEDLLDSSAAEPHLGIDESGKGDYFGPLVIAAAYVDPAIVKRLRTINVRDSKRIKSPKEIFRLDKEIRTIIDDKYAIVNIGPEAYNRLYKVMGNVNRILAWGHARAIENALEKVPECPRALSDQFGPAHRIEKSLMKMGRQIRLDQRHGAESDPAVAAASILARASFLRSLKNMENDFGMPIPRGATTSAQETARRLVQRYGADILRRMVKLHFKTTESVLSPDTS